MVILAIFNINIHNTKIKDILKAISIIYFCFKLQKRSF